MSGSVWMRTLPGVASQAVNLYLMANGASVGLTQVTLTATWQQVQVTGLMPDNVTSLTFRLGGVASGYGFMMWNPMLEDQGIQGTSITNILPYSQLPGASSWSGTSYSVTSGNQPAPDGSLTASTITADPVNTGSYIYDSVANPSPESGQPITGSVYLRSSSSLSVAVLIMEKVGTTISTCGQVSPVLNTTWQRVIVTCTSQNPASQLFLRVGGGGFANSASFQLWGAQLELATTAGPYVATDATSVTASNSLTNILQYSQQPNGPSWVNTYNFPGVTNAIVAPDGSKTAYEATAPGGSGWLTNDVSNPPLYNNATVTASVYLRVPSGTGSINFYLIAENPSGRVLLQQVPASLNTTWRRFSTTQPLPNSLTRLFIQIGENETTGQIVDVWGSQIELSNHAGPYIETSSLPVITGSDPVNILPNSQNLSGANWGMASGSCSTNAATAVDGTNTAAICTSQSTSTDSYLRATVPNPSLYDGETVTASVYLRSISGTQNINLYLKNTGDQGASTMAQSSITATTTWQRFDLTATLQNGSTFVGLQIGGGNSVAGGQGFEVWGAQFVIGSTPAPYSSTNGNTTVYATGQSGTLVPTGLNQTYAYDSFGNILQNGSFNSSYTAKNQLFGYAYDAAGNLLSDGMNIMTWDAEGRMSTASGATYIYDADGNRVEKQGSTVTDTVYFGGKPIARYSGGQWTDLIYGPTGLLAEVPGTQTGSPVYRVTDHLGTNVGSLLANGTFVNPVDYMPFGQVFTGNTNDPYLYTSLERDGESGFDHAMFRQYSSNSGRWMSPDPYSGSIDMSNPQSFNRYNYVGNNPLVYTDPSGLFPCGVSIAADGGLTVSGLGWVALGACAFSAIDDIFGMFRHPKFHGATSPRPNAQPWDEHGGFHVNPNGGIGEILGLPQAGCEFGSCGMGSDFTGHRGGRCTVWLGVGCKQASSWFDLTKAYTFSVIVPFFYGLGPAGTATYVPSQKMWCGGGGVGASIGHSVSGGPVVVDPGKARDIISGWSVSGGYGWSPFRGVQGSWNTSGATSGPSFGIPGGSAALTYSWCSAGPGK